MADFADLRDITRIQELDMESQTGGHHMSPYYQRLPALRRQQKPQARSPRQIQDTAFVMGIPVDEITPRVHEAMTIIMHEMDSIRWDLDIAKKHEAFLVDALDHHETLPVVSRHAFNQYLIHAAEHVERTQEPSFLVFLKLLNTETLWEVNGAGMRDGYLHHAATVLRNSLEQVNVIGALDNAEFGIIMNLYQEEAVTKKMEEVAVLLQRSPFHLEDKEYPIELRWGYAEILAQSDPAKMILMAGENARQKVETN